ncbi:ATP-binding protein [Streptomyces chiangmaiensis]
MSPHTPPSPQLLQTAGPHRAYWQEFPSHRSSVRVARHSVDAWLASRQLPAEVVGDAVLLVSELVTNAVIHTLSTQILCGAQLITDSRVRLEVHDEDLAGRDLPRRRPGTDDECGRGLLLVQEIAESWGWTVRRSPWAMWYGRP